MIGLFRRLETRKDWFFMENQNFGLNVYTWVHPPPKRNEKDQDQLKKSQKSFAILLIGIYMSSNIIFTEQKILRWTKFSSLCEGTKSWLWILYEHTSHMYKTHTVCKPLITIETTNLEQPRSFS